MKVVLSMAANSLNTTDAALFLIVLFSLLGLAEAFD
jgi:hypothetical protein